jgi:hypothetical protein
MFVGALVGFHVRGNVDEALLRRRREHNARSLTRPFIKDYRDEFNALRNSVPVDDAELAGSRPYKSVSIRGSNLLQ